MNLRTANFDRENEATTGSFQKNRVLYECCDKVLSGQLKHRGINV